MGLIQNALWLRQPAGSSARGVSSAQHEARQAPQLAEQPAGPSGMTLAPEASSIVGAAGSSDLPPVRGNSETSSFAVGAAVH